MRQVGVLAAAARIGLGRGAAPLAEDHAHAARLARGLAALPGLEPETPETNILMCRVSGAFFGGDVPPEGAAAGFLARAEAAGVRAVPVAPDTVRFVTHRDVAGAEVDEAVERLARISG
jgi:threonine aldolase